MNEAKFCAKCGQDPSSEGGFYFHNCPAVKPRSIPHPPTATLTDTLTLPKPLTKAQIEAKKKRAEALKDLDLSKLLEKFTSSAAQSEAPHNERRRNPSRARPTQGKGAQSALISKGEQDYTDDEMGMGESPDDSTDENLGIGEEILPQVRDLAEQGLSKKEIMAALSETQADRELIDEYPEAIEKIIISAMRAKNSEKGWNVPVDAANNFHRQMKSKSTVPLGGGNTVSFNWLIEKSAEAFDYEGMDDRLVSAAILEKLYNLGYFPEDTLSAKASYYAEVRLPALLDMMEK